MGVQGAEEVVQRGEGGGQEVGIVFPGSGVRLFGQLLQGRTSR